MPRDFKRVDRIAGMIQKRVAEIIQHGLKETPIGIVTISHVVVSKDISHAKIFVSIFPEELAAQSVKTLNEAAGFIRGLLAKKLVMRTTPALTFYYDDTVVKATKLSKLIDNACSLDKKDHDELS